MAKSKDPQIRRWRSVRRLKLRRADRARGRREAALKSGKKAKANSALKVLRRNRTEASALLKKIRHRRKVLSGPKGLVWFDGKKVPSWIADELQKARKAGRWKGYVVSGWRDPVYSEKLCYDMCGRAACPGKCAGRASNHSGIYYPAGAVDVTDYTTLKRECARLELRIKNNLPVDLVHFSANGK